MHKMRVFLFVLFILVAGATELVLCADDPGSEEASPLSAASGVPELATPEMPKEVKTSPEVSEETTPGVEDAVKLAQQEVRDPFAAEEIQADVPVPGAAVPGQIVGPEIKVELQGIGFGSKDGYAVIGDEVFYVGDEKSGIKLLEVRRREVDILVNGGKITVPLFQDQDLQKAKDRAQRKSGAKGSPQDPKLPASSSSSQREQLPL